MCVCVCVCVCVVGGDRGGEGERGKRLEPEIPSFVIRGDEMQLQANILAPTAVLTKKSLALSDQRSDSILPF